MLHYQVGQQLPTTENCQLCPMILDKVDVKCVSVKHLTVRCQPVTCPVSPPVTCDKPGQVLVNTTTDCCEIYECSKL
ncbi:hypothetical protein cypCar_00036985, partial [Cyprinus carpio]